MVNIPAVLHTQFERCLQNKGIPEKTHGMYKKWLRYYLDFCRKYSFPQQQQESLPPFLKKLQEKRQTKAQQEQAVHAITLYYELLESRSSVPTPDPSQERSLTTAPSQERKVAASPRKDLAVKGQASAELPEKTGSSSHNVRTGKGVSWQAEYAGLVQTLKDRGYAPTTSKKYTRWVQKFQAFTRSKTPESLSSNDAEQFFDSLTMKRHMRPSTRKQAFDAVLFFYTRVLNKQFELVRPSPALSPDSSVKEIDATHSDSPPGEAATEPDEKNDSAYQCMKNGRGASWETEYLQLTNEMTLRHYSPKTLKAYTHWVRKFQAFTRSKSPKLLEPQDVKEFLTRGS